MKHIHHTLAAVACWLTLTAVTRAQEPRWVVTHEWKGHGALQTEMFPVLGRKWKIVHNHTGNGVFQISVYDEKGGLLDMAANRRDEPGPGVSTQKGTGTRYLAISGAETEWCVSVQQYLSVIEEWHLTQLMRQAQPLLRKLGTWSGEDTESEYEFTVPEGSWKVVHSNSGGGLLQVTVRDDQGMAALAANTTDPGEATSWVHRAGHFLLHIKATGTAWRVEVFCQ